MKPMEEQFEELKKLEDNWSGEGSPKINLESIQHAKNFLKTCWAVPTVDGDVQLGFRYQDFRVEIEFDKDGLFRVMIARFPEKKIKPLSKYKKDIKILSRET